jgi:Domain of unknown function (DUF1905)
MTKPLRGTRNIFVSSCEPNHMTETITHTGPLWRWTSDKAPAAWHFITIDDAAGEALAATALMRRLEGASRGFGSIKVTARIGDSVFRTSVFPAKELGWMLPVKAAVRKAEGIGEGDVVEVVLEV